MAHPKFSLKNILVLIATITFSTADNTEYNSELKSYYDQKYVKPLEYYVEIRYYSEDNTLFGSCGITINISRPVKFIKLRSVSIIVIDAALIDHNNNDTYKLLSAKFNEENEILTISFNELLLTAMYPNIYTLNITYLRNINELKNSFLKYDNLMTSDVEDKK